MKRPDFTFTNHLSLWMIAATTRAAHAHLVAFVSDEATWLGRSLAVEHRYVADLAAGLQADGFTVRAS
jgi:hypothetical protein